MSQAIKDTLWDNVIRVAVAVCFAYIIFVPASLFFFLYQAIMLPIFLFLIVTLVGGTLLYPFVEQNKNVLRKHVWFPICRMWNSTRRAFFGMLKSTKEYAEEWRLKRGKFIDFVHDVQWTDKSHWYYFRCLNKLEFIYRQNTGWVVNWWAGDLPSIKRIPLIWSIRNWYSWPSPFMSWAKQQELDCRV